jgi:itaconate CoA-transferase
MTEAGPLAAVRVVGLEHSVAGPLCTRLLRDMGADVIKVERPGSGDFSRHWDENAQGEGAQFWWLNRGKRSIALDLKAADDRRIFDRLLETADVLVHNLSPAAARRLGFSDTEFDRRFPALIQCQISGYGATGPYEGRKAYDMLVQAESGIMSLTGTPEAPFRVGVSLCDVSAGMYAASLVLGALIGKHQTGRGCRLEVPMIDAALEFVAPMLISYANAGVLYERIPQRHHAITPYGVFRCAGGEPILVAVEQNAEWRLVCERLLDKPELASDPRFATNTARVANRLAVDELMSAAFAMLTREEAVALCERLDLAYGVVNDMAGLLNHPALRDHKALTTEKKADGRIVETIVGLGERQFGTTGPDMRPPALDGDRSSILRELTNGVERSSVE